MSTPDCNEDDRPGRLGDGFNMLARDFDRAVAYARLSGLQTLLLQQAREASWTEATLQARAKKRPLPDPLPFKLNLATLSDLVGCSRRAIGKAFAELVAMRLFVGADGKPFPDGGPYLIEKDYRKWVVAGTGESNPPTRLLSRKLVAEALKAKRFGQLLQRRMHLELNSAVHLELNSAPAALFSSMHVEPNSAPPTIEDRARRRDSETRETNTPLSPPTGGAEETNLSRPRPTRTRRPPKRSLDDQVAGFAARLAAELAAGKEAAGG